MEILQTQWLDHSYIVNLGLWWLDRMLLAIKCDTFNNNAILIPLLLVPCGKFCIFWWSWWALLSHWKNVHDKRKITFSVFFMDITKHIIWKFPFEITAVLGVYTLWFKICYVYMVLNQYLFTLVVWMFTVVAYYHSSDLAGCVVFALLICLVFSSFFVI